VGDSQRDVRETPGHPELIATLGRDWHLILSEEVRNQLLETANVMAFCATRVEAIEVVDAELGVGRDTQR
jgi:hypothetical protein